MHVVILRALNLGDFLTGVPAFRAIRRAFPNDRITLAAPARFAPLVDLLDGAIDDIADTHELAPLPAAARDADLGIDLHGKGPECHRLLLAAGARRLIAFRNAAIPESAGSPEFDPHEHEVARWCRLLAESGIPADPDALDLRTPDVAVPHEARGATLLHPGAASESRRWPPSRWSEVARAERARGHRVVITGGTGEVERAHAIARGAEIDPSHVFAGRTTLDELAALVAVAGRVVCGDTGVAHLATAYRRPSVVLFGPTPPSTWGPPARAFHRVLWSGTTGDPHGERIDPGLQTIEAHCVIAELEALRA